jgi:hypothetical protein
MKKLNETPSRGTTVACPNCELMATAQQKLAAQNILLRNKLDRFLITFYEVFDETDGLDWRENLQRKEEG